MQAITYTTFGAAQNVLRLQDVENPAPGPGEICVKLALSGVNPSDVKSRAGTRPGVTKPAFPLTAMAQAKLRPLARGWTPRASGNASGSGTANGSAAMAPQPATSRCLQIRPCRCPKVSDLTWAQIWAFRA